MFTKILSVSLIAAAPLALAAPVLAETTSAAPAPASAPAARFSTAATTIGDLLDNPATKAILDKHLPGFSADPRVEMGRGFTLRAIQPMVAEQITVAMLDAIDADLAKL
jgi:hypothetical protein